MYHFCYVIDGTVLVVPPNITFFEFKDNRDQAEKTKYLEKRDEVVVLCLQRSGLPYVRGKHRGAKVTGQG